VSVRWADALADRLNPPRRVDVEGIRHTLWLTNRLRVAAGYQPRTLTEAVAAAQSSIDDGSLEVKLAAARARLEAEEQEMRGTPLDREP
jgi:hypothetical protein